MGILRRDWIAGTMLVVAGLFILGTRLSPDLVPVMPLVIGLLFLGVFFLTRSVSALEAGSVLVGVGIGVLVVRGSDPDVGAGGFLISLAGGFFLAWVLGLLFNIRSLRIWPILPGLILLVIGVVLLSGHAGKDVVSVLSDWWPVLLVLMGAYLLLRAKRHGRDEDETTAVPVVVHREARPVEMIETDQKREHADHDDHALDDRHDMMQSIDDNADEDTSEQSTSIPSVYPLRPSTHSIADATGGQVGGDRPGSVESV